MEEAFLLALVPFPPAPWLCRAFPSVPPRRLESSSLSLATSVSQKFLVLSFQSQVSLPYGELPRA